MFISLDPKLLRINAREILALINFKRDMFCWNIGLVNLIAEFEKGIGGEGWLKYSVQLME